MLHSLQMLRGFAALAVVVFHVNVILQRPEYGGNHAFEAAAVHGFLGVNFFFVLSGMIILMAHERDLGRPQAIGTYLYRRIVRIYPAYWVYLTGFLAAAAFGMGYSDVSWDRLNLLSSFALINFVDPVAPPLKVAWTLFFEVRFYILFVLLIVSPRLGTIAFAAWTVAIVAGTCFGVTGPINLLSPWNIYFVAGLLGVVGLRRIPPRFGVGLVAGGLAVIAAYVLLFPANGMEDLIGERAMLNFLLAPAFAALVTGVVLWERNGLPRPPRLLGALGDASYSIYLVHSAAISVVGLIAQRTGLAWRIGAEVYFVGTFVLAVVAGVLAYHLVERPLLDLLRRRSRRSSVPVGAGPERN